MASTLKHGKTTSLYRKGRSLWTPDSAGSESSVGGPPRLHHAHSALDAQEAALGFKHRTIGQKSRTVVTDVLVTDMGVVLYDFGHMVGG